MPVTALDSPFLGNLFGSPTMRKIFDARVTIERYLEVEIALAEVEAALGLIPAAASAAIESALKIDRIDLEKYARELDDLLQQRDDRETDPLDIGFGSWPAVCRE